MSRRRAAQEVGVACHAAVELEGERLHGSEAGENVTIVSFATERGKVTAGRTGTSLLSSSVSPGQRQQLLDLVAWAHRQRGPAPRVNSKPTTEAKRSRTHL